MIFNQEAYAEQPLYQVYLLGGVGMAALVMGWLRRAKVPKRECIIIALLLGGVFGVALSREGVDSHRCAGSSASPRRWCKAVIWVRFTDDIADRM